MHRFYGQLHKNQRRKTGAFFGKLRSNQTDRSMKINVSAKNTVSKNKNALYLSAPKRSPRDRALTKCVPPQVGQSAPMRRQEHSLLVLSSPSLSRCKSIKAGTVRICAAMRSRFLCFLTHALMIRCPLVFKRPSPKRWPL